jgi:hypothetical protein
MQRRSGRDLSFRNSAPPDRLSQEPIFTNFPRCLFALRFDSPKKLLDRTGSVLKLFQNYWKARKARASAPKEPPSNLKVGPEVGLSLFFHRAELNQRTMLFADVSGSLSMGRLIPIERTDCFPMRRVFHTPPPSPRTPRTPRPARALLDSAFRCNSIPLRRSENFV